MYKKGLLEITTPLSECSSRDEDGDCASYKYACEAHNHDVYDSRDAIKFDAYTAFLPHSCDAWVIGGPEQIKAMIEDLQAILKESEKMYEEVKYSSSARNTTPD